jgi:signal transduction histidine kinase
MMKEKYWFYFILDLLLSVACLYVGYLGTDLVALVVYALVTACLLTAKLLAQLLKAPTTLLWIIMLGLVVDIYLFNRAVVAPLFMVLLLEMIGERVEIKRIAALAIVVNALLMIAFEQLGIVIILAFIGTVVAIGGTYCLQQLNLAREALANKDKQVDLLQAQLDNQRETISAIEQQGRQAERNRLASRIHDKIGHGVTGSVLMLEAAMIQLDSNPTAARTSINQATENLRSSVDGIRAELREERAVHNPASLAEIAKELEIFERDHPGVQTRLIVDGPLEEVSQTIWVCIFEALSETLTNLLKHSNASQFEVRISLRNRLIYAVFSDNGSLDSKVGRSLEQGTTSSLTNLNQSAKIGNRFLPRSLLSQSSQSPQSSQSSQLSPTLLHFGIGLQSIEERCYLCGGKSFFDLSPQGFTTKMTFTLKEGQV